MEYEEFEANSFDKNDVSNWLISLRQAGFDPELAGESSYRELTLKERDYLDKDLQFLDMMPVKVIMDKDGEYPEQFSTFLGKRSKPKVLFCMGDASLFHQPSIMVCGARNASLTAIELSFKCGRLIAETGYTLISGYARGVDIAAHLGALEGGGSTIAMLPYGLSRFRISRHLSNVFDPDFFLAVSELPPTCGFMVKAAFRRNKLLVAFADAVIVIEPGESGGTWHSVKETKKMHKLLFFIEGKRPNIIPHMESIGGKLLKISNGVPQLGEVYKKIQKVKQVKQSLKGIIE